MKKKNIIATASAVAMAAVLALGGTLAYYQSQAVSPVENIFVDQGNSVSIAESDWDGDDDYQSNTYSIIPGTTDTKDPVVTAEYTLDSYVYVTVDDTTGDLITWDAASAWTKLAGYDNVYYLLLKTVKYESGSSDWADGTASDTYTHTDTETGYIYTYDSNSQTYTVSNGNVELYTYKVADTDTTTGNVIDVYTAEIHVMADDTISYSSSITNDTYEGYGSTVSLDFTAYIIQAWLDGSESYGEPSTSYATAAEAYAVALGAPYVSGATYTFLTVDEGSTLAASLASAVSAANSTTETTVIVLPEAEDGDDPVALSSFVSATSDMVIDLSGNTLTGGSSSRSVQVSNGAEVTLVDGTIKNDSGYGVMAFQKSSVTLDNVDVTSSNWAIVADNSEVTITGSAITSDAAAVFTQNGNNTISLTDCTITAGTSTGIGVWSQGANNEITVDSCTVTSNYFGIYQNGSYSPVTITLKDSIITDAGAVGVYISNASTAGREKQTLVIDNCTITGGTAVECKHTNATITNSKLVATGTPDTREEGNGSCSTGYSLACTTNSATDYVTGTVVVNDCNFVNSSSGSEADGYYFVYQVAEDGSSVTIDGTTVTSYNSYNVTNSNNGIAIASLYEEEGTSEVTASVAIAN